MHKAEEDIRMLKHVLQIKVCCHLPSALEKLHNIILVKNNIYYSFTFYL